MSRTAVLAAAFCLAAISAYAGQQNFGGVEFPGGVGYTLPYGGNMDAAGMFVANGRAGQGDATGFNTDSEAAAPFAGTLTTISWNTTSGDATTVLKVFVDQVLAETVTLSGVSGVDATLSTTIAAGDLVSIEYDAGTDPNKSTATLFVEQ